jgi:hypothetical protein
MVQSLNPAGPNGHIRRCFNVLTGNYESLLHPYDILYSCISKEHQLDDDFEFFAAMATVIFSSRFHGNFIVQQHLHCNCHTRKLNQEGMCKKCIECHHHCLIDCSL